jgi:hypothetical protein
MRGHGRRRRRDLRILFASRPNTSRTYVLPVLCTAFCIVGHSIAGRRLRHQRRSEQDSDGRRQQEFFHRKSFLPLHDRNAPPCRRVPLSRSCDGLTRTLCGTPLRWRAPLAKAFFLNSLAGANGLFEMVHIALCANDAQHLSGSM